MTKKKEKFKPFTIGIHIDSADKAKSLYYRLGVGPGMLEKHYKGNGDCLKDPPVRFSSEWSVVDEALKSRGINPE